MKGIQVRFPAGYSCKQRHCDKQAVAINVKPCPGQRDAWRLSVW